jgi:hypothetical protein
VENKDAIFYGKKIITYLISVRDEYIETILLLLKFIILLLLSRADL